MSASPGYGKITDAKVRELRLYDKTVINRDGNVMTGMLMTNCIQTIPTNPLVIKGNLVVTGNTVMEDITANTISANVALINQTLVAGNNLVVGGPTIFFGNVAAMCDVYVGKDLGVGDELTVEGVLRDETARRLYAQHKDASVSLYIDDGNGGASVCSGSFITGDGDILTAAHCCSPNNAANVFANIYALVTNYNSTGTSRVVPCNFVGMDGAGDVAVLHVDGLTNQPYLQWGNSTTLSTGDHCFVIGNPLGIDHQSITDGLIRDATYVQTEPPCYVLESLWTETLGYAGNSGSPILDLRGNVVGVYTYGQATFEALGGGPTQRIVQPVIEKIMEIQDNYYTYRGELGIATKPLQLGDAAGTVLMTGGFDFRGILIQALKPGGAADMAGLMVDDIIVALDGVVCGILDEQTSHTTPYWHKPAGSTVQVQYVRPSMSLTPVTVMATLDPADLTTDYPFSGWS
jgi:S1-C subfamily serine protease